MRSHIYVGYRLFFTLHVNQIIIFKNHFCIAFNFVLIEKEKYKVLDIHVKFINKSKQKYASVNTEYKKQ